ncbi:hypothetical protein Agub_g10771, partial [Astrephomene gubernaculifera]
MAPVMHRLLCCFLPSDNVYKNHQKARDELPATKLLAAAADPNVPLHAYFSLMLQHISDPVALFTHNGTLLANNTASVLLFERMRRAHVGGVDGASASLQFLFATDMEALEEALQAVEAGRTWRGLLHIPTGPDVGSPASPHASLAPCAASATSAGAAHNPALGNSSIHGNSIPYRAFSLPSHGLADSNFGAGYGGGSNHQGCPQAHLHAHSPLQRPSSSTGPLYDGMLVHADTGISYGGAGLSYNPHERRSELLIDVLTGSVHGRDSSVGRCRDGPTSPHNHHLHGHPFHHPHPLPHPQPHPHPQHPHNTHSNAFAAPPSHPDLYNEAPPPGTPPSGAAATPAAADTPAAASVTANASSVSTPGRLAPGSVAATGAAAAAAAAASATRRRRSLDALVGNGDASRNEGAAVHGAWQASLTDLANQGTSVRGAKDGGGRGAGVTSSNRYFLSLDIRGFLRKAEASYPGTSASPATATATLSKRTAGAVTQGRHRSAAAASLPAAAAAPTALGVAEEASCPSHNSPRRSPLSRSGYTRTADTAAAPHGPCNAPDVEAAGADGCPTNGGRAAASGLSRMAPGRLSSRRLAPPTPGAMATEAMQRPPTKHQQHQQQQHSQEPQEPSSEPTPAASLSASQLQLQQQLRQGYTAFTSETT